MVKKLLLTCFFCVGLIGSLLAQDRQVTGKVTASEDGGPLPGVNVSIKGTNKGTQTDANGIYRISVPNGAVLLFSYVGYTTQQLTVGNRSELSVQLVSNTKDLEEVVVTAFGIKQPRKDIAGAMSTVKGKEIENLPVQSFDRALQGRAAGVQITSTSGIPGAAVNVRIRGVGSISAGSTPLYVIDGVQVASGDFTRSSTSANALATLNPNDIETIDVLKDAAATAIYGAQGANGVVVITTKKGKSGKTQFSFNSYYGYNEVIRVPKLLTGAEWVQLGLEAYANRYGKTSTQYAGFASQYPDAGAIPTYDWFGAVSQKASTQNYEISASGGDGRTSFATSASYLSQDGQVVGTKYKRGTARVKLEHKASDKLTFNTSINLSTITQNTLPADGAFANISRTAQLQSPVNPIYNADGSFNTVLPGAYDNFNPLQVATFNYRKGVSNQIQGAQAITYNLTKDLYFRTNFAIDYLEISENSWNDPRFGDGRSVGGSAGAFNTRNINFQTDQTLGYGKTFGAFKTNTVIGFNYKSENYRTITAQSQGFPTYQFQQVSSGATPTTTGGSATSFKIAGYFANTKWTYNEKYTVEGTLRYDGSSRFGESQKYGLFPSGAIIWRMKNEPFMSDVSWVDDLKFRVSYGSAGNQSGIGNFDAKALYSKSGDYVGSAGIAPGLGNTALKWERSTTIDFGLDFTLFNNKITTTIDYFNRENSDLLLSRPLPNSNGFGSVRQNIGKMKNEGIEFSVNTVNVESGKFRWTTDFNFTYIWNRVTELLDGAQVLAGDQSVRVGYPIGAVFSYRSAGVNPADGRAMWYDTLGNITYVQNARDRVVLGSTFVPSYGGLTNTFTYGGLSLDVVFNYQYGNLALNQDRTFFERSGSTVDRNQYAINLNRWQQPGDITGIPKPFFGGTVTGSSSQYAISDRFYEDGSYIRLKQVTLSYRLPKTLLQRLKLNNARIYAQGVNLWTVTKYQGIDPEFVNGSGDFGQYPQYKNYIVGLNLSF
ncbi:MAG: TonB-dependent receptor [Spirosomataceae bacterium]